jgi:hypothetical protein
MKKFLSIIFALLVAISFSGCVEYTSPTTDNGDTSTVEPENPSTPEQPSTPSPEPTEDGTFSVTLYYDNDGTTEVFTNTRRISAQWTDGQSINTAQFSNGVAKIKGLDGDYQVTLSALPDGYTYNPNINTATNDNKDIAITLYAIIPVAGGTGFNSDSAVISQPGAYRATLSSSTDKLYYKYTPLYSGTYSLTSMLDVTANEINPVLTVYYGSSQYVNEDFPTVIDGGSVSGSFTKNFKWEVYRSSDTKPTYIFVISAESISNGAFPVDIDFYLEYTGEYSGDDTCELMYPTFDFDSVDQKWLQTSGTFKSAANIDANNPKVLQNKFFKYNSESGFYHVYDEVKYASTNGYGPVLYAKLTRDCEIISTAADALNLSGNMFLNLKFVEKLHMETIGKDYRSFFYQLDSNRNILYEQKSGYALQVNSNGAYPVTEELKQLLEDFANCNPSDLFRDGYGDAETGNSNNSGIVYNSDQASQWLFACGYYE